jgi:hypothetical protein
MAGTRPRPRGQTVARYLAPGCRRLNRALRRAEPGAVVGRQLRRGEPAEGFQLSPRDIRPRLSLRPNFPRRPHPDLRGILHPDGRGLHRARLGRAAGAGALAAGRDFTHHESRWARAAARGGRLVRAARQMARSRAAMAHEDVRADRAARRHRRRPAVSGIRLPAIRLLGRRGGRVGDVDRRLARLPAGGRRWSPRASGSPAAH